MNKLGSLETQIREAFWTIGFRDLVIDPDGYQAPAAAGSRSSEGVAGQKGS